MTGLAVVVGGTVLVLCARCTYGMLRLVVACRFFYFFGGEWGWTGFYSPSRLIRLHVWKGEETPKERR